MQIESGLGNGFTAGVNYENRLMTQSVNVPIEHHVNHFNGLCFNALFSQSATAADDCIFYMQNTSETDVLVKGVHLAVSATCTVYIELGNEAPGGTTSDVSPINLNLESGNSAAGNFYEGPDLQPAGGGALMERYYFAEKSTSSFFNFQQDLILPKNTTMTIWCDDATSTVMGTVVFNYHGKDFAYCLLKVTLLTLETQNKHSLMLQKEKIMR